MPYRNAEARRAAYAVRALRRTADQKAVQRLVWNKATQQYREAFTKEERQQNERRTYLQRKYGLSLEQEASMLLAQSGCCKICKTDRPWTRNAHWCVDHNHSTGKVRGLLCSPCNTVLGMAQDKAEVLRAAIRYLENP